VCVTTTSGSAETSCSWLSSRRSVRPVHDTRRSWRPTEPFEEEETTVVVTIDAVPKLAAPAALVADRWGEIAFLEQASAGQPFRWPDVDELLSWAHFIEIQCPECPP
jgi:hypothetical protein